jgi:hypothetical protein
VATTLRPAPRDTAAESATPAEAPRDTAPAPACPRRRGRDADGMAVASFVLGLVGLLVANVFLGPVAIVLAGLALLRGTTRRGRAFLGMGLGAADLLVLAVLVAGDHTLSWSLAG